MNERSLCDCLAKPEKTFSLMPLFLQCIPAVTLSVRYFRLNESFLKMAHTQPEALMGNTYLKVPFYIVRVKCVWILFNGTALINNYTHFAALTLNITLI